DDEIGALAGKVVVAGEALPGALVERWRRVVGDGKVLNEYGPTEATVGTCVFPLLETVEGVVPIGRPLPNMTMRVLDAHLRPVPVGAVGELFVGGAGVARGYVGDAARTADRFVPDLYGPVGSRMYRTGDLARWRSDGAVEFLGRIDDQVKVRGYRIELGEVRAALVAQAGVVDAAVVVSEEDQRLIAYVVGEVPELADVLPEYMIPSVFVQVDAIPLTANGKLDRRALPDPDQDATDTYVAPRTPAEERIAAVWSKVLGVERVGVEDNFFDLGGHSIKAIALVGALRAEGFEAAVRDVFQNRTVAGLAATLTDGGESADAYRPVEPFALIGDEDRDRLPDGLVDAYPLAQVQLGMLVEMLADDGRNKYHNTTTFRIKDGRPFDVDALRAAGQAVVERHEMLRASFDLDAFSVPLQLIHATADLPVTVLDLRGKSFEQQAEARRAHIITERATAFQLDRAPLLRVSALIESDEAWWLSVSVCHPITEGWSHRTLLSDIVEGYLRLRAGGELREATAPGVRYADFVAAEQASLDSEEDRAYWRDLLTDHAKFELPAGWGDAEPADRAVTVQVPLGDLTTALRSAARTTSTSLKAVLHAAHLKVMSQLTVEDAFCTGLVSSGRPEVEGAERVYGMYLNTVPFAHRRGASTWRELIRQAFDREAELWPHRRFPMPVMQRELGDGTRLLDVRFSYLDLSDAQADSDLVDADSGDGEGATEFGLAVAARGSGLLLTADPAVLGRTAVDRLAAMYRAVLESIAADVDGDARETFLPAGELERVLMAWNDSGVPVRELSVPELIAEQMARRPEAVALSSGEETLSFAELDVRANRLAHRLREAGVGVESSVA
ncbi:condensation domain-containing protein, partial [Streptomyces coerulescens]